MSTSYIEGNPSFHEVTEAVCRPIEKKPPTWFLIATLAFASLLLLLTGMIGDLVWNGVGVWGLNNPVGWGFDIINMVFWVGIGHAGTLISAILFLFRQRWRNSINRFAEAMTLFAVLCALVFPGIHIGRVWMAYYLLPLPNQMAMWPNFHSPLLWDVFGFSAYFTISLVFWYMGLIPDIATLRDRATTKTRQVVYGLLALGWRGSARNWVHFERAYLLLAGLATVLVVTVCSVVSMDFATAQLAGWHATIFPLYFFVGAVFCGFAMVVALLVLVRKLFGLEHLITVRHLEVMNKVTLATGLMVGYIYLMEFFAAWYSGNIYEKFVFYNRIFGPYGWAFVILISCNIIFPQLFWFKKIRTNLVATFIISCFVILGMWFERFIIIVGSLYRDFLPSSWGHFTPTIVDVCTLIGSFGLFFTLFMVFLRFLPMVAVSEVKMVLPEANPHGGAVHD